MPNSLYPMLTCADIFSDVAICIFFRGNRVLAFAAKQKITKMILTLLHGFSAALFTFLQCFAVRLTLVAEAQIGFPGDISGVGAGNVLPFLGRQGTDVRRIIFPVA